MIEMFCNQCRKLSLYVCLYFILKATRGFGGAVVTANALHLFDSRLRAHDISVKIVRQRSTEGRGFSAGAPVSSHREC